MAPRLVLSEVDRVDGRSTAERALTIARGIDRMVGSEWKEKMYAHPLIAGTGSSEKSTTTKRGPSYIPSRSFAKC